MNNYIINIKFPKNYIPLKGEIINIDNTFREVKIPKELITDHFSEFIDSLNLSICYNSSRAFYRNPFCLGSVHVDAFDYPATKMNFIYDSFDCKMSWYELLPEKSFYENKNTVNEVIRKFNEKDCKEIFTSVVDNHCLINAMIPHKVKIKENNFRIRKCYSFCLLDKFTKKRLEWSNAIEILQPFLIT